MSIKQFRPMTPGTRFRSISGFDEITRTTPEKSLLEPKKRTGGREARCQGKGSEGRETRGQGEGGEKDDREKGGR